MPPGGVAVGCPRTDVKWLSPHAYRQWLNAGLRGFTAGGLPDDSWEGVNEDRDVVAFADGLYGSGLRRGDSSWKSPSRADAGCTGAGWRARALRAVGAGRAGGRPTRPGKPGSTCTLDTGAPR